jgi:hypothetical protein
VEAHVHPNRFDQMIREYSTASTRRGLLRFLAGIPLVGVLAARLDEETEAGRRRGARHHSRGHNDKKRLNSQRKSKKAKNKGKKKEASPCANAGQMPKNGKRCCRGLVKDGTGRCASPPPAPNPSACATTCSGCCAGETCITAQTNAACGTGGAPCAPCTPPQTCGGGTLPGVCGCTPMTTCPESLNCGSIGNGCGTGMIDCGDCTGTDTCGGGTPPTANVCGCTPTRCDDNFCGEIANQCGGTISCNTCKNPTPICVDGNTCAPCQDASDCGTDHLCWDGECFACNVCDGPAPCENRVQRAIDLAPAGGIVYICPGTYNETIVINKNLTLIGAGSGESPADTVLNANGAGRVVTATSGFNLGLESIRITGGIVTGDGGGIYFFGDGEQKSLTMTDCVVSANRADGSFDSGRGGGIFNEDGKLAMTGCSVVGNSAFATGGGIYTELGSVTLDGSSVTGRNAAKRGGGIYNDAGTVTLRSNSSVTDNDAADPPPAGGSGGGIFNSDGTVIIEPGSSVTPNRPDDCIGC